MVVLVTLSVDPALKYGAETPGGVEEITIGLTKQLKEADRVGMVADDFTVTADEVAAAGDNLVLELFDPSASIDDMRRMLDPQIVKNDAGVEVLSQDGYTDALSSINTLVKSTKVWMLHVLRHILQRLWLVKLLTFLKVCV